MKIILEADSYPIDVQHGCWCASDLVRSYILPSIKSQSHVYEVSCNSPVSCNIRIELGGTEMLNQNHDPGMVILSGRAY